MDILDRLVILSRPKVAENFSDKTLPKSYRFQRLMENDIKCLVWTAFLHFYAFHSISIQNSCIVLPYS